mmetsp:Transcript_7248/g.22429  ORF Transcript_7248/g.22429 Transcript_7248/m.22429 type:complete len:358 (-) Transcript_7248:1760-2833(-)
MAHMSLVVLRNVSETRCVTSGDHSCSNLEPSRPSKRRRYLGPRSSPVAVKQGVRLACFAFDDALRAALALASALAGFLFEATASWPLREQALAAARAAGPSLSSSSAMRLEREPRGLRVFGRPRPLRTWPVSSGWLAAAWAGFPGYPLLLAGVVAAALGDTEAPLLPADSSPTQGLGTGGLCLPLKRRRFGCGVASALSASGCVSGHDQTWLCACANACEASTPVRKGDAAAFCCGCSSTAGAFLADESSQVMRTSPPRGPGCAKRPRSGVPTKGTTSCSCPPIGCPSTCPNCIGLLAGVAIGFMAIPAGVLGVESPSALFGRGSCRTCAPNPARGVTAGDMPGGASIRTAAAPWPP